MCQSLVVSWARIHKYVSRPWRWGLILYGARGSSVSRRRWSRQDWTREYWRSPADPRMITSRVDIFGAEDLQMVEVEYVSRPGKVSFSPASQRTEVVGLQRWLLPSHQRRR